MNKLSKTEIMESLYSILSTQEDVIALADMIRERVIENQFRAIDRSMIENRLNSTIKRKLKDD